MRSKGLEQLQALEKVLPHIRLVAEQLAEELDEENLSWPTTGLARVAEQQANFDEALRWSQLALERSEVRRGPNHPDTATNLNNLAALLQATNRPAEAEALYRRALAIDEASYGQDHPKVAIRLNNLAGLLQATNRLAEAEPLISRAIQAKLASLLQQD